MTQNSSIATAQITSWDNEAVSRFAASGETDILVLRRESLGNFGPVVEAGRVDEYVASVNGENIGSEVRAGMSELSLQSPELESDIVGLAISFLDQFNIQDAKLRIEITKTQSCPKFHCDNVNVRLVTTYLGTTTEYQYAGENDVHAAPLFALVLLKGHQNSTCRDSVHHRSPEVPAGQRRLCVAIDF